ncbi:MAG: 3-oxoacyl-ACP reductase FabG [Gammaproteobacteria bacterium]|nr:3-oxoacyl-ACP reductase FabG [Gammaproteobacteria bacterium]
MNIESLSRWPGFEGKTAVVTGASRGIGQTIAEALARQGATVVGTATSANGAAAIEQRLRAIGDAHRGLELDVGNDESVAALIDRVNDECGAPAILVNNAGITRDNILLRMSADEWDSVLSTNLSSIYRMSKAVLRGMIKARYGRIINIGSVVGLTGNPGQSNYAAAKAGLIGFSKSLAREVASRNITVNTVAPGFIETDMTRALNDAQVAALTEQIPSGALGSAADVAAAVVYLASEAGRYITGETLNVNGGLSMQ